MRGSVNCICLASPLLSFQAGHLLFSLSITGLQPRKSTANHKCESKSRLQLSLVPGTVLQAVRLLSSFVSPQWHTAGEKIVEVLGAQFWTSESLLWHFNARHILSVSVTKTCQFLNISIWIFLPGPLWNLHISPAPSKASWDPGFYGFIGRYPGAPWICQSPLPCFLCYSECCFID